MKLGHPMPAPYADWRFVESDLYDTASRVQEYDADARLVRQNVTGQLGLARWHRDSMVIAGGRWMFACELQDPDTSAPLRGEPDGRVLSCQRMKDAWRFDKQGWLERHRAARDAMSRREAQKEAEIYDGEGDHAERFISAMRKDAGVTNRAFIPNKIGAAA